MKLKIGYKVVQPNSDGKLMSAIVTHIKGLGVEYKVGELIEPLVKNSKLMAFATHADALAFVKHSDGFHIYEAILVNPEPLYHALELFEFYTGEAEQNTIHFWHDLKYSHYFKGTTKTAPTGTLMCEAIQLVKRVINL